MIDLESMSTAALGKLISDAMAEYQRRIAAPTIVQSTDPAPPLVRAPIRQDESHVTACLRLLRTGGVIRADDVREYRRIANEFPEWLRLKRYPDDVRGAAARRYVDFSSG